MVSAEQRRAMRLAIPLGQDHGELRIHGQDYPVRLIDQSAGGFGIQSEIPLEIKDGDIAALSWSGGCCRVRVLNRCEEENFTRIGVERLEELDSAEDLDIKNSIWSLRRPRMPMPGANLSYFVYGVLVVVGCSIAGLTWGLMPHDSNVALQAPVSAKEKAASDAAAVAVQARARKSLTDFSTYAGREMHRALDSSRMPKAAQKWVAQRVQVLNHAMRGVMKAVVRASADTRQAATAVEATARSTIDSIGRAATMGKDSILLELPRFMNNLQLTKRQRRELDKILKAAHDATQDLQRRSRELGTQEVMQQIAEIRTTASQQALAALSPEQTEQLLALVSNGHSTQKKPPAAEAAPKSAAQKGRN
jgi:hypothetical protein